jgi:membrane protease YdiL (CAAX protease family)
MTITKSPTSLGWKASLGIYVIFASVLYVTHYILIPSYTESTGKPYLIGYLWGWTLTMGLVFSVSLALYKLEGNPTSWSSFAIRFRFDHMPLQDWFWSLGVIVVATGFMLGLSFTAEWLAKIPFLSPHPLFPAELRPGALTDPIAGEFMGLTLKGQWGIAIAYFIGWLLNIFGEEFFYRGWMLPRQEVSFEKYAWAVNGTMFCFQHFMQPWNFLAIWPGALFMAFVIQRRQNTWIGIVQHGLMNFTVLIFIIRGVIG